jgi:formylmethanofuran dehydrogenase subunit E
MMRYPSFYDRTPAIRLFDPLADFLGATEGGIVEIGYLDCVKLAGHSCPTVAGAYRMAQEGLKILFADQLPHRSTLRVELAQSEAEGVAGVTGQIIGCITGAGGIGGFKGIGDRFARNNRLLYGVRLDGDVRLTRLDTGRSVTLSYDPSKVPGDPAMKRLMHRVLHHDASPQEYQRFRTLWQERTEAIATAEDPTPFITISEG